MGLYAMTTTKRPRLLGVFAHPDDEIFCAGGLLAQWVASGGEAMVISATRGEAGQIQDARVATRQTLGTVREQELHEACAHLGVEQVECLDYRDGTLADVDGMRLAHEIVARIRAFQPDAIVTFGPDGGYGHPDHIAISVATTAACQLVAREGNQPPQLYYSSFPAQHRLLCLQLARWLTTGGMRFCGSAAFVRALALLADEATMLRYVDDTVETQWFPAGFSIIEQGEPGVGLYLIISGHAEIVRENAQEASQPLRTLGPGEFFGQQAFVTGQPHAANAIAKDTVTCLVLSARTPTAFDGRGSGARLGDSPVASLANESIHEHLIGVDVSGELSRKVTALAAHRSQFAIERMMFPDEMLRELFGNEYFAYVSTPDALPVPSSQTVVALSA